MQHPNHFGGIEEKDCMPSTALKLRRWHPTNTDSMHMNQADPDASTRQQKRSKPSDVRTAWRHTAFLSPELALDALPAAVGVESSR
jgi:hypothetical protein